MQLPVSRSQLRGLTSLRFFAAMLVVAYHCSYEFTTPAWAGDLLRNGYEAVSFFFVLSGFILTYVYAPQCGGKVERRTFWPARVARICPVYYIALLIDLPRFMYSALVVHTIPMPQVVAAAVATPLFLQSWFPSIESIWNTPAWSLSVEAFFYAIFPWLVEHLLQVNRAKLMMWVLPLVVIAGGLRSIAGAETRVHDLTFVAAFLHYWPPLHLPQFLVGIGAARLYSEGPRLKPARAEAFSVLVTAAICGLFWGRSHLPRLIVSDAILTPLYAFLIYTSAQSKGTISRALSHGFLVGLGEISYGVYILHVPLFFLWTRLCQRTLHIPPVAAVWLFLPVLLTICASVYTMIEKPCRRNIVRTFTFIPHSTLI